FFFGYDIKYKIERWYQDYKTSKEKGELYDKLANDSNPYGWFLLALDYYKNIRHHILWPNVNFDIDRKVREKCNNAQAKSNDLVWLYGCDEYKISVYWTYYNLAKKKKIICNTMDTKIPIKTMFSGLDTDDAFTCEEYNLAAAYTLAKRAADEGLPEAQLLVYLILDEYGEALASLSYDIKHYRKVDFWFSSYFDIPNEYEKIKKERDDFLNKSAGKGLFESQILLKKNNLNYSAELSSEKEKTIKNLYDEIKQKDSISESDSYVESLSEKAKIYRNIYPDDIKKFV
ncbi:hypothetical protein ACLSZW_03395, partial [Avibacterium avium]|uniref:hypothetical protein n=1 Tax=Avibacterium avium TaxID=751 RepID=UPI003BF7D27F